MNRRQFIRTAAKGAAIALVPAGFISALEAKCLAVTRVSFALPNLPPAFHGKTIAFLSDIHHSCVVPREFIDQAVETANALDPDIVILGGDYVTAGGKYRWLDGAAYIAPCFDSLKNLRAKIGRYAVTGNHDTSAGLDKINPAIDAAGFTNLDNTGVWLGGPSVSGGPGARLRLCGVADLRTAIADVKQALGNATDRDAVILVSHNPDTAEEKITDNRVGLQLSGHTHGGQVVLPFIGGPFVDLCSGYRQKYRYGLVQGPKCPVFTTSGVGTLPPAFRFNCPPEIALITLVSPTA